VLRQSPSSRYTFRSLPEGAVGIFGMLEETKKKWRQFYAAVARLLGVVVAIGTVWLIASAIFQIVTVDPSERESTFGSFLAIPFGIFVALLLLGTRAEKPPN
ncbi:MAG: hypothetical protein WBM57_15525, partial [Woeseiaceae bacterium]